MSLWHSILNALIIANAIGVRSKLLMLLESGVSCLVTILIYGVSHIPFHSFVALNSTLPLNSQSERSLVRFILNE